MGVSKQYGMKKAIYILASLFTAAAVSSCTVTDDLGDFGYEKGEFAADGDYRDGVGGEGAGDPSDPSGSGNSQAGRVTAGEWNDLDHWTFWSALMTGEDYSEMSKYWGFWTNNRVAFRVSDKEGKPLAGVKISLERNDAAIWSTRTDNRGFADAWIGLSQKEECDPEKLVVVVNGVRWDGGAPVISTWNSQGEAQINEIVLDQKSSVSQKADIAFIVDATGSMGDEIAFLKDDLMDILKKAESLQNGVTFRTAALFYRDVDDEYLTRISNFTTDFSTTTAFISKQDANGGGDYPEAVHTALEEGVQKLSWDEGAKTRIAFMLLDAPAHHEDGVLESLHELIPAYAKMGIKLIPIAASGVDKNTEFMLRFFAVATGGTYVFITNDSGIGNDHIEATVGEYEVEALNALIVRLIKKYTD